MSGCTTFNIIFQQNSIFKQLMRRLNNIRTPKKKQGPTPQRRKKRRLDFEDHDGDSSSCALDSAESSNASAVMLDTGGSSTPPPSMSTKPLAGKCTTCFKRATFDVNSVFPFSLECSWCIKKICKVAKTKVSNPKRYSL